MPSVHHPKVVLLVITHHYLLCTTKYHFTRHITFLT